MAGQVAETKTRLVYEDGKIVLTDKREQDWKITYNVLTEDELDEIFEKHPTELNEKLVKAGFVTCTGGDYLFAEQRYAVFSILLALHDEYYQYKHNYNPNDPIEALKTYSDFAKIDDESLKIIYRKIQKEAFKVLDDFRSLEEKQYYQKHVSMLDKINIDVDKYNVGDDFTELAKITSSYYIISQYKQIERQKHAEYQFEFKNSNNEKVTCSIVYNIQDYVNYGYKIMYIKDRHIGVKLDFDCDEAFSCVTFLECPPINEYEQEVLFDILLYIYKKTHNRDALMAMLETARLCGKYREIFVNDVDYDDDDILF